MDIKICDKEGVIMVEDPQVREQSPKVEFRINLSLNDLIAALKNLSMEDREFFLENILAALSPEYLESIEEARRDYREGRILDHDKVFQ